MPSGWPYKRLRRVAARMAVVGLLALPVAVLPGCAANSASVQTDPTIIAQRAIQVVRVLDSVVEAIKAFRDAGILPVNAARAMELGIQKSLPAIKASPDGGKAIAVAALKEAGMSAGLNPQVAAYLTWGSMAIGALP